MKLDFFRSQDVAYPELCFLVSSAVGFAVSIYWIGAGGPGAKDTQYQVMCWSSRSPGEKFWDWYVFNKPQFFATPEEAAAVFVQEWQRWKRRQVAGGGSNTKGSKPRHPANRPPGRKSRHRASAETAIVSHSGSVP